MAENFDFQLQLSVVLFLPHPQLVDQMSIYVGNNLKPMR